MRTMAPGEAVSPAAFERRGRVAMLGTDPRMRGGIAAVVTALQQGGLFEQADVRYLATHVDGGAVAKVMCFVAAVLQLCGLLLVRRVSLVHAHVSSNASLWRKALLLWLARASGVPTIFHLHSGAFDTFVADGSAWRRWCARHTMEKADRVLVLSTRWADWARGFAPRARVEVVGNPVRVPPSLADRRARASDGGRVLYLGLIAEAKGSFDLLQAWARCRPQLRGWRLMVGGNGAVERFLGMADQLGIRGDIDYLGWVAGADKDAALDRADIFVLPSYREGMPVSVLEAMAHGASVIVSPVGGVPDMMTEGVHGLWVRPGDIQGLADRVCELAGTASLRSTLARNAHEHVKANFSLEFIVARIHGVYRELLSASLR